MLEVQLEDGEGIICEGRRGGLGMMVVTMVRTMIQACALATKINEKKLSMVRGVFMEEEEPPYKTFRDGCVSICQSIVDSGCEQLLVAEH